MRRLNRLRQLGQTLVEFALTIPVLLVLVFGVLDVGRAVVTYNLVAESARSGARAGQINPVHSVVETAVLKELGTVDPGPSITSSTCTIGGEPYICVTVSSTFHPIVGAITGINSPITLSATSQMYLPDSSSAVMTPLPTPTPGPTDTPTPVGATPTPEVTPTPTSQYTLPSKFAENLNPDEPQAYDALIQCINSGAVDSTKITWTSQNTTTIYFLLWPTSNGQPSAADLKNPPSQSGTNSTGVKLNQTVAADVPYTLWVLNAGNGGSDNYDATVSAFNVYCPH